MAKHLIWVQNTSSTGDIRQAADLSRALISQGQEVIVVSSEKAFQMGSHFNFGDPPPIREVQKSERYTFDDVRLTPNGKEYVDDTEFQKERSLFLQEIFEKHQPDSIITQHYPSGRQKYTPEVRHLLEHAKKLNNPPFICSLARDIGSSNPSFNKALYEEMIEKYYDQIIVAGQGLFTQEDSIPEANKFKGKTKYVGYFIEIPECSRKGELNNIVYVTVGGGKYQYFSEIFDSVINATAYSDALKNNHVVLILGPGFSDEDREKLRNRVKDKPNYSVVAALPDFRDRILGAKLVIATSGVNTAIEVANSKTPALYLPFALDNSPYNEQVIRARKLSQLGYGFVASNVLSSPEEFGKLIDSAISLDLSKCRRIAGNGAQEAARIITEGVYNKKTKATIANKTIANNRDAGNNLTEETRINSGRGVLLPLLHP